MMCLIKFVSIIIAMALILGLIWVVFEGLTSLVAKKDKRDEERIEKIVMKLNERNNK